MNASVSMKMCCVGCGEGKWKRSEGFGKFIARAVPGSADTSMQKPLQWQEVQNRQILICLTPLIINFSARFNFKFVSVICRWGVGS